MRLLVVFLAVLVVLLLAVPAESATLTQSTTWRQTWTNYNFPSTAQDTPQFLTRYIQLPSTVAAGDVVVVAGREEFTNPSWNSLGGWTINGAVSEHWSTPVMLACGMKKAPTYSADPNVGWSWIAQQVAENFDGAQHHGVWTDTEMFVADSDDAGDYLAVVCYFSRSLSYRDPDADYITAHPSYGKIEAGVF